MYARHHGGPGDTILTRARSAATPSTAGTPASRQRADESSDAYVKGRIHEAAHASNDPYVKRRTHAGAPDDRHRRGTRTERPDASRPRVVSVLSQKRGTEKTTLSCTLAALATRAGTATAILDLDPQASAAKWHDLRRANGEEDPPVFVAPNSRMQALVDALGQDGAELIVTDTAPHSGADAVTVARLSDHILIPLQPSFPDLAAITRTIDIAEVARTPATIVLNLALVNHPSTGDARTAGAPAAPVVLHRRVAHVNSFNLGCCAAEHEPAGKAAGELLALFGWLRGSGIIPVASKGQAA